MNADLSQMKNMLEVRDVVRPTNIENIQLKMDEKRGCLKEKQNYKDIFVNTVFYRDT